VVNEVALKKLCQKALWQLVKEIWIEMTRQLHCTMLKLLMPEIQKIKSILEKYGNGKPFDQNASLLLKPNNAFLSYLGNATTVLLLMNGTILEIQTYLFNPSDAAQNPKMISEEFSRHLL
jgi:hypothetical protein